MKICFKYWYICRRSLEAFLTAWLTYTSEKLQLLPEQLDAKISDKHFLSAVDILQDGLRMITKSDLESIGALTDLRIYFSNQETVRFTYCRQNLC